MMKKPGIHIMSNLNLTENGPEFLHRLYSASWRFFFFALIWLKLSCVTSGQWASEIIWPDIDKNNLPAQIDFPNAEAITLLDEGEIKIHLLSEHSFSTYTRHTVTRIFNPRGYHLANIVIPYSGQSKIDYIEARTIAPDGEITVLNEETIFDVNLYPNFVFYSDQRARIFTLPAVEDNCVIEYRYGMTINSQTYGNSWRFQREEPVVLSRFTLIKPKDWELDYRLYDLNIDPATKLLTDGQTKSLTWQATDLEPLDIEPAMPSLNEVGARLALRPVGITSWQDISKWYSALYDPQMSLSEEMELKVQALTKDALDDREKLKIIFEWVRDQIRYIAVSIGIGGFQPHPVIDIMENRYGDCKDMTTLLCALAGSAGLTVHQALVSTHQSGMPDTTLPSATQFNHVIAYAPEVGPDGMWMDATEKTCAFGQLPWYDQDVPVLIVDRNGNGRFKSTPGTSADQNTSRMSFNVNMDSTGGANISGSLTAKGTVANEMREQLYQASPLEIKDWLQFYLAERIPGANLRTMQISGQYPVTDPLEIYFEIRCSKFAVESGNELIILPEALIKFNLPDYLRTNERMQDIHLQFASTRETELLFTVPDGWRVRYLPAPQSIKSGWVSAGRNISNSPERIEAKYFYKIPRTKIPALEYHQFQDTLDQIRSLMRKEIVLQRN